MTEPTVRVQRVWVDQDKICLETTGYEHDCNDESQHIPASRIMRVTVEPTGKQTDEMLADFVRLVGKKCRLVVVD